MYGGSPPNRSAYIGRVPEPTEFEKIALPLFSDCYAFALSLCRHAADAEDLVQETYLRAMKSFASFEPGTNAKAWLFTILRRIHIDKHRRAKIRPAYLPEEELEGMAPAEGGDPAADSIPDVTPAQVRAALETVPEGFRIAVRLRDLDGFSYKDIGEILNIPPGTVMSRIHRGREYLRRALVQPHGRPPPPDAGATNPR